MRMPALVVLACLVGAASGAASLPLQTSVSKDGITWTFDHAVPVGRFVTGDCYVVGPVTVTSIDPPPQQASPFMNGSVLNLPTASGKSAFDSRLDDGVDESWWFDASARAYAPLALKAGDALVSSISLSASEWHNVPEPMRSFDTSISPVKTVSVLTVLAAPVDADAFRPSYGDRSQVIRYARDLHRDRLRSLPAPNPAAAPSLAFFADLLRRPWIDTNPFLFDVPSAYMPCYGQRVSFAMSFASLALQLDFPADEKVALTDDLVQYGIDLFGLLENGFQGWPAFGGHRSGRKLPILFAGALFGDQRMLQVSALHPDAFGEDMQTMYVRDTPPAGTWTRAWQGATVVYAGHYGVRADGTPVSAGLYGPYEHLQPRDWPRLGATELLGEAYRRANTSTGWIGEALAARLMGLDAAWNHAAFFDYCDRWMSEDDAQAVADILAQTGQDFSADWTVQRETSGILDGGIAWPTFIDDMWHAYRAQTPPGDQPPTVSLSAGGTTFVAPATIVLTATAADGDGSVAKVEFWNGTTLLAADTTAPYAFTWSGVGAGSYALTAKAYDDQGATTTSAPVSVAVDPSSGGGTTGSATTGGGATGGSTAGSGTGGATSTSGRGASHGCGRGAGVAIAAAVALFALRGLTRPRR